MRDTKERILRTSLSLFAREGYEAVSVSSIAEALGMTKGALYKHYPSKRAVFDDILARMEALDASRAAEYGVPEGPAEEMGDAYRTTPVDAMVDYARAQFRYWTEDELAAPFRRMLTLEQFRSPEMGRLYQQYLVSGPLGYMADLFSGLGLPEPQQEAAAFYAPMFLLYGVYDGAAEKAPVTALMDEMLENARARLKAAAGRKEQEVPC